MYLQQVEINGFKSFRDKTVITFSQGVTAIVGRNGHGKSNLVDAIKWVLGAGSRATKDLRIKKQQDIIFAGTYDDKGNTIVPPKDRAEVAITFSNEDNSIKIGAPTVEIRRVVERNGNSEYYINRNKVKADDIRSLLYDTGVGKAGYSVLEQGKISKLLSDRPEERRSVFEEAAGISRYKREMEEASRDMTATESNIKIVEVDYNRLKRLNERLKVQKDNLVIYKKLKTEVFDYSVKSSLIALRDAEKQKKDLEERIEKNNKIYEELKTKVEKQKQSAQDRNTSINNLLVEKNKVDSVIAELSKDLALLEQSVNTQEEKLEEEKDRLESVKTEAGELKNRHASIASELKIENQSKEKVLQDINAVISEVKKLEKAYEAILAEAQQLEKDLIEKDEFLQKLRVKLEKEIDEAIQELYLSLGDIKNGKTTEIKKAEATLKKLEKLIGDYKKAQPVFVDELFKKRQEEIDKKKEENSAKVNEKNKLLNDLHIKMAHSDEVIKGLNNATAQITEELKRVNENEAQLKKIVDEIKVVLKNYKEQKAEKEKAFLKESKTAKGIEAELQKLTSKEDADITNNLEKMNNLKILNATYQGKLEANEATIAEICSTFFDEYGRSINEMQSQITLKPSDTKEDIRSTLAKLTQKIKECGNINEYAEDEYNQNNEEYLLIKHQLEDLEKAKEDIKTVVNEIRERSRVQFLETFAKIQESFDDTFKIMFGGGNALLELHAPEGEEVDPLSCGIDIKVQPPGKAMRLLGLSGGEADKVAAVLLFAIYRIKSTPFCILDEIDHAWDSHNISAFLEMLKHFTEHIQFLIVTHSTQTAQGVDRLLAITQVEDGISKTLDYTYNREAIQNVLTSKGKGIRLKG